MTTDVKLTPTETLVVELLAAQQREGAVPGQVPASAARALNSLADKRLVTLHGDEGDPRTASLTDLGSAGAVLEAPDRHDEEPAADNPARPADARPVHGRPSRPSTRLRDRIGTVLANTALMVASPHYRQWVDGVIRYGMNAAARDAAEERDSPAPWWEYLPETNTSPSDANR